MTKKLKSDIQQTITDRLISIMEKGELPWSCPWQRDGDHPMPYNFGTKAGYNGINILLLWSELMEKSYSCNGWLTFKQASELGGKVIRGEKSTKIIYFQMVERRRQKNSDDQVFYPMLRQFNVFNLDQIEGIDVERKPFVPLDVEDEKALNAFNQRIDQYCINTGLTVKHKGQQAYYSPAVDLIKMPQFERFNSQSDYLATYTHELIHSTGHKTRLARFDADSGSFNVKREAYAFEELVAELGSAFLCGEFGIKGQHEQHASYLQFWLKHLKDDKSFIFKAAAKASKASEFFLAQSVSGLEEVA